MVGRLGRADASSRKPDRSGADRPSTFQVQLPNHERGRRRFTCPLFALGGLAGVQGRQLAALIAELHGLTPFPFDRAIRRKT